MASNDTLGNNYDGKMIAIRLREARNRSGLSQAELASASGVDQSHISNLERGVKVPSLRVIIQLANAMNISIDSIAVDQLAHAEQIYPVYIEKLASLFKDSDADEAETLYEILRLTKDTIRQEVEKAAAKKE